MDQLHIAGICSSRSFIHSSRCLVQFKRTVKDIKRSEGGKMRLKNDEERKAFLKEYGKWKVIEIVPSLNTVVHEYQLPDESRILVLDFGEGDRKLYPCMEGLVDGTCHPVRYTYLKKGQRLDFREFRPTTLIGILKKFKEI